MPTNGDMRSASSWSRAWAWIAVGAVLLALAALLVAFRGRFSYDRALIDIPARPLAAGLVLAGLAYLAAVDLVRRHLAMGAAQRDAAILGGIVALGAVLRLLMLWTTPALEDDYNRYLWDGGVTANGFDPFRWIPARMLSGDVPAALKELAEDAGVVLDRVNHPHLRTIYPPMAQAAFALAYLLEPWSLLAWRMVCLAGEAVSLALLLTLLRDLGRSPLWIVIYWLNPVVIKEMANSAHMEAVLVPLVLGAVLLAVRRRHLWAIAVLALATGTKIWPALLAPLFLRPLVGRWGQMAVAVVVFAGLVLLMALPPLLAGLDGTSGFVAYAREWRASSALYPALQAFWSSVMWLVGMADEGLSGRLARAVATVAALVMALLLAVRPVGHAGDLVQRAALIVGAVVLLSPAQFPWYLTWAMPLLVLRPIAGLIAATALMPIYYVSFYFSAIGSYWIFRDLIVWAIWLPIWGLLIAEAAGKLDWPDRDRHT